VVQIHAEHGYEHNILTGRDARNGPVGGLPKPKERIDPFDKVSFRGFFLYEAIVDVTTL
jgi:hypothetical protein